MVSHGKLLYEYYVLTYTYFERGSNISSSKKKRIAFTQNIKLTAYNPNLPTTFIRIKITKRPNEILKYLLKSSKNKHDCLLL